MNMHPPLLQLNSAVDLNLVNAFFEASANGFMQKWSKFYCKNHIRWNMYVDLTHRSP